VRWFPTWRAVMRATAGIFISYTLTDQQWAEWIAWVLEEEGGYRVLVQAWDFVPGTN
jgi:hypothetical protein